MTEFAPSIWILPLANPVGLLTANDRNGRYANARMVRAWRTAAYVAALAAKLPRGLARVRIDVTVNPIKEMDEDNLRPLVKAIVDGFGPPFIRKPNLAKGYMGAAAPGYGLIPNDNRVYLDGPYLRQAEPRPPIGAVTVTIVDLTGIPRGRTWTPEQRTATGVRGLVKRACNGCGRRLGDVTYEEIAAGMSGEPLPDTRGECLACLAKVAV